MEKELKLLNDFPAVSGEMWKQKVMKDLMGADFQKLIWKTYDGFEIQPFYTPEDLSGNRPLQTTFPEGGESDTETAPEWINYTEIRVEDPERANAEALKMLSFDATGFLFYLVHPEQTDFVVLLKDLAPDKLHLSFRTDEPCPEVVESYFRYCEKQNIPVSAINGFYESDLLETWTMNDQVIYYEPLKQVIRKTSSAPGFYGLSVRSHAFADSGSNHSQEIAFTLSKVVEYAVKLSDGEISAERILNEVMLHMAVGSDYFFEIAKLRALRTLFHRITDFFDIRSHGVRIFSSSNLWSKTVFDPNVNMLRNTTEAMSAILGGCNGLLIRAHDSTYRQPSDHSRRIALNISNILREEAYFSKVSDPAAGSYYIECLTDQLARTSLALFQHIEREGGFITAFESGEIPGAIRAVRNQKQRDLATRKLVAVGTNKYPDLQETIRFENEEINEDTLRLQPQRSTYAFDRVRLKTQQHFKETGFIPKVYLACFGNLAMRKARATFSAEFFGTAGFRILEEVSFENARLAAEEAASCEADIVVMCASNEDYALDGEGFARVFKARCPEKLLVLAGYPASLVDSLKAVGIDAFIHMKTNAVEALTEFQNRLFEQQIA